MRLLLAGALSLLLVSGVLAGPEEGRASYDIPSSTIGGGGAPGAGPNFRLNGTLGQSTPVGRCGSADFDLHAGFWKRISIATGVIEGVLPPVFRNALFPNAPNPFNPSTTIRYELAGTAPVEIVVYGVGGRAVRTLVREMQSPGPHETVWDGRSDGGVSAGSGVYLCALRIGEFREIRKMVLLK